MVRRIIAAAAISFALAAASASAQDPDASQAQDLSNCAGAVAAVGGIDPLSFMWPPGPYAVEAGWPATMSAILDLLHREPGLEGMTGRYAASAAKEHWAAQPRAEREAAAAACRARYG